MAQVSGAHFVITLLTSPRRLPALVCLAGEIDMEADPALSGVVARLSATAPTEVVVDLAEVTFASSTLLNFLARAHLALAADSTLVVCRPGESTLRLLRATNMEDIVTLRADLPVPDHWMPSSAARRVALPTVGGVD
ncbi:STAS domain-containing protein [Micromonospora sp. HM134]|uniref:STAS domain-containing protein n=1 Tax=Micromonospora sp. HM134 TaxID=2583243 RepID=UPI001198B843|nr:STAS domain-containing protein [Micromonospora sp. HM134]QDY06309.1 STAS domain-containing protein [Micromonospora sp. HM134]